MSEPIGQIAQEELARPTPDVVATRGTPAKSMAPALVAACLLALTFLPLAVPPPTNMPDALEADPSLSLILDHAHQTGIQFGTEHIYTFGPLGYLLFFLDTAHGPTARLWVNAALGLSAAVALCLLAWRLRWQWRFVFLGLFVLVAASTQPRADLVLNTSLFCWGLLCLVESGRRLTLCAIVFTLGAVLSSLAKV